MIGKDWIAAAAAALAHDAEWCNDTNNSAEHIAATIEAHTPFKRDTAYMPVPRCDNCKHWRPPEGTPETGLKRTRARGWCWLIDGSDDLDDCKVVTLQPKAPDGLKVNMWTMGDFGCVQWEAKQP